MLLSLLRRAGTRTGATPWGRSALSHQGQPGTSPCWLTRRLDGRSATESAWPGPARRYTAGPEMGWRGWDTPERAAATATPT
jgi:hypothetical protein